ncbi:hypothetical protein V2J09_004226 [Rumex salicifolius]
MKKWANTKCPPSKDRTNKALLRKYEGPFKILAKVAYILALTATMKIHPVVHVSMFKRYHLHSDEPSRESSRTPTLVFNHSINASGRSKSTGWSRRRG